MPVPRNTLNISMRFFEFLSEASIFSRGTYTFGHKVKVAAENKEGKIAIEKIQNVFPDFVPSETLEWVENAPADTPKITLSKSQNEKYFKRERQLHVDYNVLLHGTGILGLILYLILFFRFLSISRSYKIMANKFIIDKNATRIVNENHALIIAMVVLSLAMSFSGGLQFSSYRIILFLFLGYFLGQSQKIILKMQLYKQEERNNENL